MIVRTFDFAQLKNRRFMYNGASGMFLLGSDAGDDPKGVRGSHAEDYYNATGDNVGFDDWLRGWISGPARGYPFGVVHFAPAVSLSDFDTAYSCLAFVALKGAVAGTLVRGFPGEWEMPLSDIVHFPAPRLAA
jgi:hypothetical protein